MLFIFRIYVFVLKYTIFILYLDLNNQSECQIHYWQFKTVDSSVEVQI